MALVQMHHIYSIRDGGICRSKWYHASGRAQRSRAGGKFCQILMEETGVPGPWGNQIDREIREYMCGMADRIVNYYSKIDDWFFCSSGPDRWMDQRLEMQCGLNFVLIQYRWLLHLHCCIASSFNPHTYIYSTLIIYMFFFPIEKRVAACIWSWTV